MEGTHTDHGTLIDHLPKLFGKAVSYFGQCMKHILTLDPGFEAGLGLIACYCCHRSFF
jgi:hypothetical protein